MATIFVKVMLAPLIVIVAYLLERRFGATVAGFFIGLPTTAVPFTLTVYLMHGTYAAAIAAGGCITGQLICSLFCIAYARTVPLLPPVPAMLAAIGLASLGFTTLALANPIMVAVIAVAVIIAGVLSWPAGSTQAPVTPPAFSLVIRVAGVTATVVTAAALEPHLGAIAAGSIAALPTILMVVAPVTHATQGSLTAIRMAGGTLTAIPGTIGCLVVLFIATQTVGMWWALIIGLAVIPLVSWAVNSSSAGIGWLITRCQHALAHGEPTNPRVPAHWL